jgi:FKBP-type peptidyl-prolyl cis-trans isomerase
MKKGEKARFTVKASYGYGKDGNAELIVPPDTDLSYVVELTAVVNQIWLTMDGTYKHIICI